MPSEELAEDLRRIFEKADRFNEETIRRSNELKRLKESFLERERRRSLPNCRHSLSDGSGRELCQKCKGTGVVRCRRCDGRGRYHRIQLMSGHFDFIKCEICDGKKTVPCPGRGPVFKCVDGYSEKRPGFR